MKPTKIFDKSKVNYETPYEVWEQLSHLIPKDKIIWESAYCSGLSGEYWKKLGYNVIHKNEDYFNYEPDNYDIQITNPPFNNKKKWIERG